MLRKAALGAGIAFAGAGGFLAAILIYLQFDHSRKR